MSLSPYALITVAELKAAMSGGFANETRLDGTLEDLINDISATIEGDLDRLVVSRGSITGYFTAVPNVADFYPYEWPLTSVTSIHEDATRQYAAATLLTENVHYVVTKPAHGYGYVTRTWDAVSGPRSWLAGWRAVKMVYVAGYASTAAVPSGIKRVAKRLGVTTWGEWQRRPDVSQESSGLGTNTRFSAAFLTADMRRELAPWRRPAWWQDYEARIA